ncbi:RNA methyltransferase, TrmH family, group 3 [Xylanimonas cellulosilytica DSM 15894]|uniref:RNA methyltransferase, TrmH family, group 3 n=1 Tax=Xylanimonas cellulosilytica (strain DSM 15894 / JCM 12276 / CECT 5975 / KCTC 9989 / LMG 20990 / NBRC 107835 / XIL07) TaxID=446471 RepID=D1BZ61_XYLCX|nr:23S rRNA (guanosine(2251)-2'-O)-methyltransferase RlmB [Xylanimonas cellulosilytica]ACZ31958.1 RNA methyltransferase, TrmH family, group 3 [Xylanimonas cellulosilytica DSM 15894]
MAGNTRRPGAVRKEGSKKGAQVGTGGHGRKALQGKGPTPKAEDREYHPAFKKKQEAEKRAAGQRQRGAARGVVRGTRRSTDGVEVIAGRNSVLEALRTDVPITTVYVATRLDHDDRTREILQHAASAGLALLEVTKPELDRLTDGQVHQGVAAQVPPYEYRDVDDLLDAAEASGRPPLIVALDGVTDPRNLGAILRSAGAFGAHGVLVPERRSAGVTASAWKVSAGAAAHVPVARATNLARALGELKKAGCFVVGLDGDGDQLVGELSLATDPLVVVVGSEGKGMGRLVRETCDVIASIPIDSTAVESLNAGVATSIALYEIAQSRR